MCSEKSCHDQRLRVCQATASTRASAAPASRQACVTPGSQDSKGGGGHVPHAPSPERQQGRPKPPKRRERASGARFPPGASGGRKASLCNVLRGNPTGLGAGGRGEAAVAARSCSGARPRTGPERERHARGRYQAAAVRRARAVTWLVPESSARNGGKRQAGAERLSCGGGRGPSSSREASGLLLPEQGCGGPSPRGLPSSPVVGVVAPERERPPQLGAQVPPAPPFRTSIESNSRCPSPLLLSLCLAWRLGFPKRAA